jgi:dienelactone hydrolase
MEAMHHLGGQMRAVAAVVIAVLALAAASVALGFDPATESKNYSKTSERAAIYDTPQYQQKLAQVSQQNLQNAAAIEASDPERQFTTDLCWNGGQGCAGDARLYDWQTNGYGIVVPVVYTARDGATISGHIWATKAGPAHRPGIVITNGSVQANEQLYWYAAQTLAKAGYVVMTWDPQGQGQSDTRGESPDQNEGVPAQSDGRPFFDGTEDAINFFYSTPGSPYVPETSCSTGTSHNPKQQRRVKAGLDSAYNPFWQLFDHKRLGLAGHSYGAAGVSFIGQWDPRVSAIVAWDNLSQPSSGSAGTQSFPPGEAGCPAHPQDRADLTKTQGHGKPALGMSADYFLPPTPNTTAPRTPEQCQAIEDNYDKTGQKPTEQEGIDCKAFVSDEYSKHGIDTGEIVIRGGSHLDFSFIPNHAFGATLRGADLIDWYTTAWFDKYVKRDPTADRRLLTNRWRHDVDESQVDPDGDGNMFSFYHRSRLDFHLADGSKVDCEDLRAGCAPLSDNDGYPGTYSYVDIDRSPDHPGAGSVLAGRAHGLLHACTDHRRVVIHTRGGRGARIRSVHAYVGHHTVGRSHGGRLRIAITGFSGRRVRVKYVIRELRGHHMVARRMHRSYRVRCG